MGQPGIAQSENRWYLISRYGDLVVRVHPNMSLGESASGELSFDPARAQLELDIDDDGGLVLRAVDDHELEPTDGKRCRQAHLARHRRAEIHLPHNVLRLDTDFVDLAPADDNLAVLAVKSLAAEPKEDVTTPKNWQLPERSPVDTRVDARPPRRTTSRSAPDDDNSTADIPLLEPMHGIPLPLRAPPPEPEDQTAETWVGDSPADLRVGQTDKIPPIEQTEKIEQVEGFQQVERAERVEPTGNRRQQILSPSMAALIGLAGISFVLLLYWALGEESSPPAPPATVSADPAPPAEPASGPASGPASAPSDVAVPSLPTPLAESQAPKATGPDDRDEVAVRSDAPSPAPGSAAEPDIEQLELPLAGSRALPPIAPTVAQTPAAAETAAGPERFDSQPDAAEAAAPEEIQRQPEASVAAEPERIDAGPDTTVAEEAREIEAAPDATVAAEAVEIEAAPDATAAMAPKATERRADTEVVVQNQGASERAQTSEEARLRALRAADVALEQGRLTTPPEASAYTLYNRVLELDPRSPEARSGLQSVRQALINRALAQLASDALDDARTSLQAAADTGANPLLVADLLREVDYRQQLINARGGAEPSP